MNEIEEIKERWGFKSCQSISKYDSNKIIKIDLQSQQDIQTLLSFLEKEKVMPLVVKCKECGDLHTLTRIKILPFYKNHHRFEFEYICEKKALTVHEEIKIEIR